MQDILSQTGVALAALCAMLILANALGALALRAWPQVLGLRDKRVLEDPLSVCERLFPDTAPCWYGLDSLEELREFHRERRRLEAFGIEYEPLTEFRHKAVRSRFVNISEHGFRYVAGQGPWPPDPANWNIFFFGGSTAFGWSTDETSIPSRLQEFLDGRLDRPVRVYNFGRGAYFSSQEKSLFMALLVQGHRPDAAVFLDGLNDFVRYDDLTATSWMYAEAVRGHYASVHEAELHRLEGRVRWFRLWMFLRSWPMFTLADALAARLGGDQGVVERYTAYEPLTPGQVESVVVRLLANHAQIANQCVASCVTPLFVVQPHPSYLYNREHHAPAPPGRGLLGNERAGDGYPRLLEALSQSVVHRGALLDLSGVQVDRKENLYIDEVHYTAAFCSDIACYIADSLASVGRAHRPGPCAQGDQIGEESAGRQQP
ncbi:MAG: SGNH/GDSL hydrolase family protein [Humidesulfovibrio sp.]|nr:SGNH/GDSL hydrolase family protein [Humidesulfovibrio sp.]